MWYSLLILVGAWKQNFNESIAFFIEDNNVPRSHEGLSVCNIRLLLFSWMLDFSRGVAVPGPHWPHAVLAGRRRRVPGAHSPERVREPGLVATDKAVSATVHVLLDQNSD